MIVVRDDHPQPMSTRPEHAGTDAGGPEFVPLADGGTHGPRARVAHGVPFRLVYEHLPSGVLVLDFAGRVVGHNRAAKAIFGEALLREHVRCCDLVGCRRPGTPLEGQCISALALEHPGPLPEMRIDIDQMGGQGESLWVAAAPIGGAEAAVVLQMRAGMAGDRRKRSEPQWMGEPTLRVYTLGRTRVESLEGPMGGEWLAHRPGELLKYLICERGRIVPLEELMEVFWPSAGRGGATNVRQAIHTLRDRLEPSRAKHAPTAFVIAAKSGYELDRSAVWIDAEDFQSSARAGLDALRRHDREMARPALTHAANLYRGEFLADEPYAEWALAERDRMRDLAGQVLRSLADLERSEGHLDGATNQLQRLAEIEPLDLDVQRELLAVLIERGRHQEAARRYEVVRRRYRRAFGEEPDLELGEIGPDAPSP